MKKLKSLYVTGVIIFPLAVILIFLAALIECFFEFISEFRFRYNVYLSMFFKQTHEKAMTWRKEASCED